MDIYVMNTVNGQVQRVSDKLMRDAHFRKFHVEVPAGTKPYDPALYAPKTAEEFKHLYRTKIVEPAVYESEPVIEETEEDKEAN